MMIKTTFAKPCRKIRVPVEARQHIETYKGIPVLDAFYTAGWVQEEDGTFNRYLAPTTHTEAIVLDGTAMDMYKDTHDPLNILLLTGNRLVHSRPEIYAIRSSKENDQFVEYGIDFMDSQVTEGMLAAFGLLGEHGELPETNLKSHADKVKGIVRAIKKVR